VADAETNAAGKREAGDNEKEAAGGENTSEADPNDAALLPAADTPDPTTTAADENKTVRGSGGGERCADRTDDNRLPSIGLRAEQTFERIDTAGSDDDDDSDDGAEKTKPVDDENTSDAAAAGGGVVAVKHEMHTS
jgi:hypothetical protein